MSTYCVWTPVYHSVLNFKAIVFASVIVKSSRTFVSSSNMGHCCAGLASSYTFDERYGDGPSRTMQDQGAPVSSSHYCYSVTPE